MRILSFGVVVALCGCAAPKHSTPVSPGERAEFINAAHTGYAMAMSGYPPEALDCLVTNLLNGMSSKEVDDLVNANWPSQLPPKKPKSDLLDSFL